MTTGNMRIKIRRTDLITKLKTTKQAQEAAHAKALQKYESDSAKSQDKVRAALNALIAQTDNNYDKVKEKLHCGYRGEMQIDLGKLDLPHEPSLRTEELDRMIRVLEASCDDTISVGVADAYAKYL